MGEPYRVSLFVATLFSFDAHVATLPSSNDRIVPLSNKFAFGVGQAPSIHISISGAACSRFCHPLIRWANSVAWLTIFAILTRGAMTLYHVPHLALGAELTENFHERTKIVAFRQCLMEPCSRAASLKQHP
ncbi:MAG: MFS transporter [Pseudomonadales bacterium]|nr:MFS transporter [Pseudomonadales bacterium]